MKLRDRIIELRRVPASELLPNPKNWRTHPEEQANVEREWKGRCESDLDALSEAVA